MSILRARRDFDIVHVATDKWLEFRKAGVECPDLNTCEYWEMNDDDFAEFLMGL